MRPNPKYFGFERGVTYYNLVSNQFTGLNAIVIPGTLRDSLYLLAVVLEQQTELQPTEIMTDTGAYTDVVFGLFWLLGYRFCPRIADIGGAMPYRIASSNFLPMKSDSLVDGDDAFKPASAGARLRKGWRAAA